MHNTEEKPRYFLNRLTKNVYILNLDEDELLDPFNSDFDMGADVLVKNEYSEIPESLYNDFYNDMKLAMEMEEIVGEITAFAKMAQKINKLWEELPQEANDILATEYPFGEAFDEVADKILFWKETLTSK